MDLGQARPLCLSPIRLSISLALLASLGILGARVPQATAPVGRESRANDHEPVYSSFYQ